MSENAQTVIIQVGLIAATAASFGVWQRSVAAGVFVFLVICLWNWSAP